MNKKEAPARGEGGGVDVLRQFVAKHPSTTRDGDKGKPAPKSKDDEVREIYGAAHDATEERADRQTERPKAGAPSLASVPPIDTNATSDAATAGPTDSVMIDEDHPATATATGTSVLARLRDPKRLAVVVILLVLMLFYLSHLFSGRRDKSEAKTESPVAAKEAGWQDVPGAKSVTSLAQPASEQPPMAPEPQAPITDKTTDLKAPSTSQASSKTEGSKIDVVAAPSTGIGVEPTATPAPISNMIAEQLKKEIQSALSEQAKESTATQVALTDRLKALEDKVAAQQKQLASLGSARTEAAKAEARANEKPVLEVLAITRTHNCDVCAPYALITYNNKTLQLGTDDTLAGYKVTIDNDRLVLIRGKVQHSYVPRPTNNTTRY